jgi:rifampicin phosphotransferase
VAVYSAQREATKASLVLALSPARAVLAELARRSDFDHEDFFLLRLEEVPLALGHPGDWAEVVAERRARREYLQARVPPFWFHGAIPLPPTWRLRADEVRADATPRTLSGLGVCPGTATGTARVVHDPANPGALTEGDVLVAPLTDPAWTPLFLAAAAVVVDVGAQLNHAAIVARELGIPAVVSVTGATTTIPDGATVTVDGSTGRVVVHPV